MITTNATGSLTYQGDTFQIVLHRYSDPQRLNMARNAAIYLGKSDRDNIRRPLSIIKMGHVPEVMRGEYAEFEFIDVTKEVYDHLITYTTRNMRVAGGNRALSSDDFAMPSDKVKDPQTVNEAIDNSMWNYKQLLENGETKQVARSAMPIAAKLNPFVYQFNFVSLMQSVFPQRLWEKGAQGNTVKVVKGMWDLVHHVDQALWGAVYEYHGEHVVEWKLVQKQLRKTGLTIEQFISAASNMVLHNEIANDTKLDLLLRKMYGSQKTMW
ncbi:FAD-dependent thymidylate synthase [Brevibacillus sp. NRS-1366]|uniref:FAD-dependent thymidylate synthase n=1 Tax=Brevibacillus sp. NRS-1366 TaxID=3233899 RepID=UPI003D1D5D2B